MLYVWLSMYKWVAGPSLVGLLCASVDVFLSESTTTELHEILY